MEALTQFFTNAYQRFLELSQPKRIAAVVLAGMAVASLFVMGLWVQTPDYQLLYANLSETDAGKVIEVLKAQKVPYQFGDNGHAIRVPANMVHELRLKLATEGLPEGSEVGLEIFEKTPLGMTDFVQKLNFQRAIQGELSRTIKTLEAVESARVHLVIPKDTLFLKDKPQGKASVVLKIKKSRSLTPAQVQGIVHLVSSSVEQVPPENVVVVDLEGNMLSGERDGTQEIMASSNAFRHKMKIENDLENKIVKMMTDALGAGKVIARVSAELDMERIERTEEIYDPESQVVRSEQRTTEASLGAVPPGGVAGVQSLVPTGEAQAGGAGTAAKRDKENQTFNYEINKVVKHVSKSMGELKKLSVSVLIDGAMAGDPPQYTARTPEEMAKFSDIVKTAVGYDEARGDQIKVENVQFDKSLLLEEKKRAQRDEWIDLGLEGMKYVLGIAFVLLFFSRAIRPLINWMTTSVEVVPMGGALLATPEQTNLDEEKKRLAFLGSQAQELRTAVTDFVKNDPKFTAGVMRRWLKDRTH
jgi:flagellar M-ring protein FliF